MKKGNIVQLHWKSQKKMQTLMDENGAAGASPALAKNGKFTGYSKMYFNRNLAFSSVKQLYYTMAHEFMHVSQHAILEGVSTSINTDYYVNER